MDASPIVTDPSICSGKPHIRGTRLTVELLQNLLATGLDRKTLEETYPYLAPGEITAALEHKLEPAA